MKEFTRETGNNCDMKCPQCSTDADESGSIYMIPRQLGVELDEYKDFKRVRISGGEPFNHPKLSEICKIAHEKDREVVILSCGIHNKQSIEEELLLSVRPYVSEIVFSLQGSILSHELIIPGENYSKIKCLNCSSIEDCFRIRVLSESMENIAKLSGYEMEGSQYNLFLLANQANPKEHTKRACMDPDEVEHGDIVLNIHNYDIMKVGILLDKTIERCVKHEIPFSFQTVLMNMNYDSLENMANYVHNYSAKWHWLRFIRQGRGENGDYSLTDEQMAGLKENMEHISSRYDIEITCTKNFFELETCNCGNEKLVITYDGIKLPCSALKYNGGKGKLACLKRT